LEDSKNNKVLSNDTGFKNAITISNNNEFIVYVVEETYIFLHNLSDSSLNRVIGEVDSVVFCIVISSNDNFIVVS